MAKIEGRNYDSADLKTLMGHIGGWAQGWDDAVWYVEQVAPYSSDFQIDKLKQMADDFKQARRQNNRFDTDYRHIYEVLTDKSCGDCSESPKFTSPTVNPRELADKYLNGLDFPTQKDQVISNAKQLDAPPKVMKTLEKLDNTTYDTMGRLIEKISKEI